MHDSNGRITNVQNGAYLERQFMSNLRKAHNPKRKYQAQTLIISFSEDEFDTSDLNLQAKQALMLVKHFIHQHFADAQSVVAIQADGEGGKLHAHVVFNTIKQNGRTISTNRFNIHKLRTNFDHEMTDNYQRVTGHNWTNPIHKQQERQDANNLTTRSEWQNSLKKIINQVKNEVASLKDFIQQLGEQGITVTERKKKTAWTYHQTVNGKSYKVRDFYQRVDKQSGEVLSTRGLGQEFTKSYLTSYFKQKNKEAEEDTNERRQSEDEEFEKIKTMARDARIRTVRQQRLNQLNRQRSESTQAWEQKQRSGKEARLSHRRVSKARRRQSSVEERRQLEQQARRKQANTKRTAEGPEL
ncbi:MULTISPECIES: relaxase/mobilization nuclease domain-containing protein [Limosilactobacillus]|uniref:relaxase/mobilization nuclease domain-containing protein n=1 Tax=Limosilactobacillus TaxID=2742598 RepID=UPI002431A28E|nr:MULTISPECIES: relaxase/mobilization nuclease domain-containing protein [Limosilactobacillus]MCI6852211.1 relaxase/mobilization nuclease domain-containing protein [Limosilactobacillus vaginalis]